MTLVGSSGMDERRAARLGTRWVLSVGLYIAWVFLTIFLPIPALGIDRRWSPTTAGPRAVGRAAATRARRRRRLLLFAGVFDLRPPQWLTNPLSAVASPAAADEL